MNLVTFNFIQTPAGAVTLKAILSFHIAQGTYNSAFLLTSGNSNIVSLYEEGSAMIKASTDDGVISLNGDTVVVHADLISNNGILHVIDRVMDLPLITGPPSVETDRPSPPNTPLPASASSISVPFLWVGCLATTLIVAAC